VNTQAPKIMLVAGEPSGDRLGASLMTAIRRRRPEISFLGVGGPLMGAEGLDSTVPIEDLAVMGLVEVLPRIPTLMRHIRNTADLARQTHPDVLVTIDAPGFNFRLARRLAGSGIPRIHYVAPSVWAWKPGRAKKIAPLFDHVMALLPFEPPYFEAVGLPTTFVGHPAVEDVQSGDADAFRAHHAIPPDVPVLVVLPGSRRSETDRLLPVFAETVRQVCADRPDLRIVIPTVDHVRDTVAREVEKWPGQPVIVTGEAARRDAFAAATASLAASGTVSVELAVAGVPTVIAYDVNKVTAMIAKRLVRTDHVSLVNILLKREAVPEYLLEKCKPALLVPAVQHLLNDPDARAEQRRAYHEALDLLKPARGLPSESAAGVVLDYLRPKEPA
jgi:lipid-A-disaccharide synthase